MPGVPGDRRSVSRHRVRGQNRRGEGRSLYGRGQQSRGRSRSRGQSRRDNNRGSGFVSNERSIYTRSHQRGGSGERRGRSFWSGNDAPRSPSVRPRQRDQSGESSRTKRCNSQGSSPEAAPGNVHPSIPAASSAGTTDGTTDVAESIRSINEQVAALPKTSSEADKVLDQVRRSLEKVAETLRTTSMNKLATTAKAIPQPPPQAARQQTTQQTDGAWASHWHEGAAAVEAIKQSTKIVTDAFDSHGEKSLKFDFEKTATSVMEIAERAQWLLGKSRKIKVQALEEKAGRVWSKPATGEFYCKKLGDHKLGGLRVCIPAINGMPATEVSIQVQLKNGLEGQRPVTIQGTRTALTFHAKAWVMTFGPIRQVAAEHRQCAEDLDISGYM